MKTKILISLTFLFSAINLFAQGDLAYWQNGKWYIDYGNDQSVDITHQSGLTGISNAFIGDYDGDGFNDLIEVNQQGTHCTWYFMLNDKQGGWDAPSVGHDFGISANDRPITGDFNGDGKMDIAIFRDEDLNNSNTLGQWYIDYAPVDGIVDVQGAFGLDGDIPVVGDFNGDGIDDIALYRPVPDGIGEWYISTSNAAGPSFNGPFYIEGLKFGLVNDMPVVGDFNGDGYDDIAIYRKSENKVYVNLYSQDKPLLEGYGLLGSFGAVDLVLEGLPSVTDPSAIQAKDMDQSRPTTAPMPALSEFSQDVKLRHGWTCMFDNSLDVDKWVQALEDVGINYLEFHTWMRAHEELVPAGETWNAYVGDERLWTSKAKMKEKISKFQANGGKAIGYTGIYAAAPAFAHKYPAWGMRDMTSNDLLSYAGDYLFLMSVNPSADYVYSINSENFKNFNEYFIDQAIKGQQEFNWDGWRWDWYGYPELYKSDALGNTVGNFYYEVAGMTDRLKNAVRNVDINSKTTALQLPTTYSDIPNQQIGAVADYQFLELWPDMGKKYIDLAKHVSEARARYPDKAVFANLYPQSYMTMPEGWPIANINYQYGTILSSGGFPSALIVDGVASFTNPVPFHAVRYPDDNLMLISKWNKFVEAYGGYYYFSNPIYSIREPITSTIAANSPSPGFLFKPYERRDKRTGKVDAVIVNLINYGSSTDAKWDTISYTPSVTSATISVVPPSGISLHKAYLLTPDSQNPTELSMSFDGTNYEVSVSGLDIFATVVFTSNLTPGLPAAPEPYTTTFTDLEFSYDYRGNSLNGNANTVVIIEEEGIIEQHNYFENSVANWELSNTAYEGMKSVKVSKGKIKFSTNANQAIRVPIDTYQNFEVAIKPDNSTATWFGFTLYNPVTKEIKDLYYKIGDDFTTIFPYQLITSTPPGSNWKVYSRNIQDDIVNHAYFGFTWASSVVTAVHLGPINGDGAYFDAFRFKKLGQDGAPLAITDYSQESKLVAYPNPTNSKELFLAHPDIESGKNYTIKIYDIAGKLKLSMKAQASDVIRVNLEGFKKGAYLIEAYNSTDNKQVCVERKKILIR